MTQDTTEARAAEIDCDHWSYAQKRCLGDPPCTCAAQSTALPPGFTERRQGAAVDLHGPDGRRMAWFTLDGTVYVDGARTPSDLRIIAAWSERVAHAGR